METIENQWKPLAIYEINGNHWKGWKPMETIENRAEGARNFGKLESLSKDSMEIIEKVCGSGT